MESTIFEMTHNPLRAQNSCLTAWTVVRLSLDIADATNQSYQESHHQRLLIHYIFCLDCTIQYFYKRSTYYLNIQ